MAETQGIKRKSPQLVIQLADGEENTDDRKPELYENRGKVADEGNELYEQAVNESEESVDQSTEAVAKGNVDDNAQEDFHISDDGKHDFESKAEALWRYS